MTIGELIDKLEKLGRYNTISLLNVDESRIEHISITHVDNLDIKQTKAISNRKSNKGKETKYYIL